MTKGRTIIIGIAMTITFNLDSLKRHKISKTQCLRVLADPLKRYYDDLPSKRDNPRRIWVGHTFGDRQLEIGIEYFVDHDHVYHAQKATKAAIERAIYYE